MLGMDRSRSRVPVRAASRVGPCRETMWNRYPPIADHGLVGDLQTAALVSSGGTIDWWCAPRFGSPSVFASLLDGERGGTAVWPRSSRTATG
ncbi:trehalase-like domain-containing protein [Streptomyces sp. GD-15H]|uniref:trehalase-like domain-containing protein n=1 Tax=Streptomyces sp. GD-15H TaxID=3129112 RepID=UPI00324C7C01